MRDTGNGTPQRTMRLDKSQRSLRRDSSPAEEEVSIALDTGIMKEVSDASYFGPPLPVMSASEEYVRQS